MKPFLDYASQRYYAGQPIITDAEFDTLAEEYAYEYVGAPIRDGVPHAFPMYSLQKCYVGEKVVELEGEKIETPKLDGAAVSLLYVKGWFRLALSRGDGKRGQDITENVRHLIKPFIGELQEPTQITGEIVAPKHIMNARNYAAGALNLKDPEEVRTRDLTFVAYGIQQKGTVKGTYEFDMLTLRAYGFNTVIGQNWDNYPQDGRVFRINDNVRFEELGFTAKHPRGAYALKQQAEGVVTTLRDVVWQVGRSGIVSPVAILDPVKVGDAEVSRATLHNLRHIRELQLEIGCRVELVRSGEIIPKIIRRAL